MPRLVPHLKTDKLKQMNANGGRSSNARQRRTHAPLGNGNKYEYCQRWIMDQKPREAKLMPADRPAESDDRKKRQVSAHCLCIVHVYEDRGEHRTRSPLCKSLGHSDLWSSIIAGSTRSTRTKILSVAVLRAEILAENFASFRTGSHSKFDDVAEHIRSSMLSGFLR